MAVLAAVLVSVLAVVPGRRRPVALVPWAVPVIEFETVEAPTDVAPVVDDSAAGAVRSRFASVVADDLLADLAADDVTIELFDDVIVDSRRVRRTVAG